MRAGLFSFARFGPEVLACPFGGFVLTYRRLAWEERRCDLDW
jgi:hypothetical protein